MLNTKSKGLNPMNTPLLHIPKVQGVIDVPKGIHIAPTQWDDGFVH
jgi:hypothetical protein